VPGWFGQSEVLEARIVLDAASEVVETSSFSGLGLTIFGADARDRLGRSVASAGDINGDGFDDIILGAENAASLGNSRPLAGESYLIFGSAALRDLNSLDLSELGDRGFAIWGADPGDSAGKVARGAGDVNGDGFDDLLIGAGLGDGLNNDLEDSGETYLMFGRADWLGTTSIDLAEFDDLGVIFYGSDFGDKSGWLSIGAAGDVNADGYGDMILGAPHGNSYNDGLLNAGEGYLVFGKPDWSETPTVDLSQPDAAVRLYGGAALDWTGWSVNGAFDLNGDGFDDFAIGGSNALVQIGPHSRRGIAYVVFGKADWDTTAAIVLTHLGSQGVMITGADVHDDAGASISAAGDIDGDGFDDLVIGAYSSNSFQNQRLIAGEAYLIFGDPRWTATPTLDLALPSDLVVPIYGADAGDRFGKSVAGVGDINGDGLDDILIGGERTAGLQNAKPFAGEAHLFLGRRQWPTALDLALENTADLSFYGADAGDQFGRMVSGAGDVDGDGLSDFLIGAFFADTADNRKIDAGEAYLIFGRDVRSQITHRGTSGADVLAGTETADRMVGGQGNDILLGFGSEDVLIGGAGDDRITVTDANFQRIHGGNGIDSLRIEASQASWDLRLVDRNRIRGIERVEIAGCLDEFHLDVPTVLNLSDHANSLQIDAAPCTQVVLSGQWQRGRTEVIGGDAYQVFRHGAATVRVSRQVGDVNRDGLFDSQDLIEVFQDALYGKQLERQVTFDEGDWDGDGVFDSSDLVFAFQFGAYVV
jgi:hypothetical protein